MSFVRIWVIGGSRRGDEAQACALAEELGLPFETRKLRFNWVSRLRGRFMGASPVSVERELRETTLVPPWPDLIILSGKRTVPVARWVQAQSGGRTRLVLVGHPRVSPELFDLVYTTRQYLTPSGPSVRLQPVAMSRYREPPKVTGQERSWLDSLPRPHWLLMLGGETRHWKMRSRSIANVAAGLAHRADKAGGSLIVVRSGRTSDEVLDETETRLEGEQCEWRVVRHDFPRFAVLLEDADMLFPTADSVSMISESVITGKPVGIVPVEMNWFGRIALGSERSMHGKPARDLRRFWNFLFENELAGTLEEPRSSDIPNPVVAAAREVRALLEKSFGKLPA
ncbi:MAG: ELM1/GtrOC1 family putative glycosyltransferase [Sphingomicrobium sp.]